MGTYISIKSTVNAFRYGIDPIPEWFDKISNKTDEVDVMVEGNKVYVSFVLDNYDFKKLCVLLIILSMMCDNYNFSMFNYLRSNGLCYSVNRRYIECTNRIVANLIIDVSPDKCEITKDYVVDYINNFKLIANNDNIEYAIRMIKLNDRLNIMNIEDYHDAYISFVRSRLNGVMDLYKSYESISVDDVRDMVKDITEDKLIIQYCS